MAASSAKIPDAPLAPAGKSYTFSRRSESEGHHDQAQVPNAASEVAPNAWPIRRDVHVRWGRPYEAGV